MNNPFSKTSATSLDGGGGGAGPTVTFTLPASNGASVVLATQSTFSIGGTCVTAAGQVTVSNSGSSATATATCTAGVWSTTIDLSGAADGAVVITASQTQSGQTGTATRSVTRSASHCAAHVGDADLTSIGTDASTNGTGAIGDPYLICNFAHLDDVRNRLAGATAVYFRFANDIDVSGNLDSIPGVNNDHFDGNDRTISNATFVDDGWANGLFASLGGNSSVYDLTLENCQITANAGGGESGLIAGGMTDTSTITDVTIDGGSITWNPGTNAQIGGAVGNMLGSATLTRVQSTAVVNAPTSSRVGGLVGVIWTNTNLVIDSSVEADLHALGGLAARSSGAIINSHYSGILAQANSDPVGGLVGWLFPGGLISHSYTTGEVNITGVFGGIGGLVGLSQSDSTNGDSVIQYSYSTSDVSGHNDTGGLIGHSGSVILNSYATGDVSGADSVGGLVGRLGYPVSKSYATGNVSGDNELGGFVGIVASALGTITDAYAWGDVTGTGSLIGGFTGSGGTIVRAYSKGVVSQVGTFGGFASNAGTYSHVFWNTGASGVGTGVGYSAGTGLSDLQSQLLSNYTGFTTSGSWKIDTAISPYPVLTWVDAVPVAPVVAFSTPISSKALVVLGNQSAYPISGTCSSDAGNVTITNNGSSATATASCSAGVWSTTIDLSGVAGEVSIILTATQTVNALTDSDTYTVLRRVAHCQVNNAAGDNTLGVDSAEDATDSDGTGTVGDPYLICNAGQLNDLRNRLNDNVQEYFELRNDIDLLGAAFTPIVNFGNGWLTNFDDHFNGNGLVISNGDFSNVAGISGLFETVSNNGVGSSISNLVLRECEITSTNSDAGLLFGRAGDLSTISNIDIDGGEVNLPAATGDVGGLGGKIEGATLQNARSTATVVAVAATSGGLIGRVGQAVSSISNVSVVADLQARGGILGRLEGSLSDCSYSGAITGVTSNDAGGVVAFSTGTATITDCRSAGSISVPAAALQNIGGVVGWSSGSTITDTTTSMTVSAPNTEGVGGLIGLSGPSTITRCSSSGSVTGLNYVGGLIGVISNTNTISQSYSTGAVSGTNEVGGFIGMHWGQTVNVDDSYAWGNVSASGGSAAGFAISEVNATRCYSMGAVTASGTAYGFAPPPGANTVTNSFWNTTTSGVAAGGAGTGLNDTDSRTLGNYTGFGASGNWKIDTDISPYPVMIWQSP